MIEPKPLFLERLKKLMPDEKDFARFNEIIHIKPVNAIRCNTLKISPLNLRKRLEEKGWKIEQPWDQHPEVMQVTSELEPGELGRAREHLTGLYYIQEFSSMLPLLALKPKAGELVLDLFAAPGSKTTQMAALMENKGTIIANDNDISRISILASNIERCGAMNVLVARHDAVILCEKFLKLGIKFDKILLDVPCSGEGTTRGSPKTFIMWNYKMIKKLGRMQRKFIASAVPLLKHGGELVYSTCTYAPEENEKNVDFLIKEMGLKIQDAGLPVKCRQGITEWEGEIFSDEVKKACRIFPQDNNTEGFFVSKFRKEGNFEHLKVQKESNQDFDVSKFRKVGK
jgi:NOL1/NOP2/sun family putative RNA methylase